MATIIQSGLRNEIFKRDLFIKVFKQHLDGLIDYYSEKGDECVQLLEEIKLVYTKKQGGIYGQR